MYMANLQAEDAFIVSAVGALFALWGTWLLPRQMQQIHERQTDAADTARFERFLNSPTFRLVRSGSIILGLLLLFWGIIEIA
jgi:hypothetical protein